MDRDRGDSLIEPQDLSAKRATLVRRLDDGYVRIEQAVVNGEDVAAWEDFWLGLLAEYEALSTELDRAA
ncbi:MAG: hypothetical protein M3464_09880 [Chloroflexota bacterium]|nr:hypothetical protein [Chloroflexota bacterium]